MKSDYLQLYKQQKKRTPLRLRKYDYAQAGAYFITVCTKDKEHLLGEITDGAMKENEFGTIARSCWEELPKHYRDIELDEFVVMPNHIHGIILNYNDDVGATHASPLLKRPRLGDMVGSFKSAVTKRINEIRATPGATIWQRNYYEHIIRNERGLNRIREYIHGNPLRWELDRENNQHTGVDEFDSWLSSEGKTTIKINK